MAVSSSFTAGDPLHAVGMFGRATSGRAFPAAVASIVEARGDLRRAREALKSIKLEDGTFVRNDWGEARKGQGDDDKFKDLQFLAVALTHLSNLQDISGASVTRGSPVPSRDVCV